MDLRKYVQDVPAHPEPGILFRDLTPLFADADAFRAAVSQVAAPFQGQAIDYVLGIESRGFLLGGPVALELGVGFTMVRKAGKLPRQTRSVTYELEYGTDTVEVHHDALGQGDRVLIVDDVIATGGTARAAIELARQAGAEICGCAFLVELTGLGGRQLLDAEPIHAVIQY